MLRYIVLLSRVERKTRFSSLTWSSYSQLQQRLDLTFMRIDSIF